MTKNRILTPDEVKLSEGVTIKDSANLTAFGLLRTSQPYGISENKNISSRNRNQWDEIIDGLIITYNTLVGTFQDGEEIRGTLPTGYIGIATIVTDNGTNSMTVNCRHNDFVVGDTITGQTSGATATIVSANTGSNISFNYDRSSVFLSVGDGATDRAIRQQHRPNAYVPGKGIFTFNTFVIGTSTSISLVVRTSTSGSVVDDPIPQSDWNLDKLDGKGSSGITLDLTTSQILAMDAQWLGVGRIRYGFDIDGQIVYVHEVNNANNKDVVYMKTPTLPMRFSIRNSGTDVIKEVGYFDESNGIFLRVTDTKATSDNQIEEICCSVSSEGGYLLPGFEFSTPITWAVERSISARTPVIAIRLKNAFPTGEVNRRIVRYLDFGAFVRSDDCLLELVHVHDPYDITATWTDVGVGSSVEYSTDISAVTGRPSHIVDLTMVTAGGGTAKGTGATVTSEFINDHGFISQNFDSTNSQMFIIYGTPRTGTANVTGHITWIEFD